jgi:hypothetical protein
MTSGAGVEEASSFESADAPGTAPADSVVAPIMGGVVINSEGKPVPYVGGTPNYLWVKLLKANLHLGPFHFRQADISSDYKGFKLRTTPLDLKFDRVKGNLRHFCRLVYSHFVLHGLDTIAYVRDPSIPDRMTNVVTDHARFTLESVTAKVKEVIAKYDAFDLTNDLAARTFIIESLEPTFASSIREQVKPDDTFPVVWMRIIRAIEIPSPSRYERLKDAIRARTAKQYPGENMELMADDHRRDATALDVGQQYDHVLTKYFVERVLASGDEGFRFPLLQMRENLNAALMHLRSLPTQSEMDAYMLEKGLDWETVCDVITERYRTSVGDGTWPAQRHNPDAKVPPAGFGAHLSRAEANALVQQTGGSPKGTLTCFNCGKPGHVKKDCPEPLKPKERKGGGSPSPPQAARPAKSTPWRRQPPATGEKETKEVRGRTFHWCAKCRSWTTTHGTATHRKGVGGASGSPKPDSDPAPSANYSNLQQDDTYDPYAFHLPFSHSFPLEILWIVGLLLTGAVGGYFCAVPITRLLWWIVTSPFLAPTFWGGAMTALALRPLWSPEMALFPPHPSRRARPRPLRRFRRARCREGETKPRPWPHPLQVDTGPAVAQFWCPVQQRYVPKRVEPRRHAPFHPPKRSRTAKHKQMPMKYEYDFQMAINVAETYHRPGFLQSLFNAVLTAPSKLRAALGDRNHFDVIWDTGASLSVTPCRDDFVGQLRPPSLRTTISGIARGVAIRGEGVVSWNFHDDNGGL